MPRKGINQLPEAASLRETDEVFVRRGDQEPGSRSWRATIRTLTLTAVAQATTVVRGFVRFATDAEARTASTTLATSPVTAAIAAGQRMIAALTASLTDTTATDSDSIIVSDDSVAGKPGKRMSLFHLRTWLASRLSLGPRALADPTGVEDGTGLVLTGGGTAMGWGTPTGGQGRIGSGTSGGAWRDTGIALGTPPDDALYLIRGYTSLSSGNTRILFSTFFTGADFKATAVGTGTSPGSGPRLWISTQRTSSGNLIFMFIQRTSAGNIQAQNQGGNDLPIEVWRLR